MDVKMQLIEDLSKIKKPFSNAVLTIGNFDGVHKGHLALFELVRKKAEALSGTAVAVTFDPHPLVVLRPEHRPPLITLREQKVELIEKSGLLDVLVMIPFNRDFAAMAARDFINLLIEKIGMKALIVGPDYAFGRNREGNIALLKELGSARGFEVIVPDWVLPDNAEDRISSTAIRKTVADGKVEEVVPMLGRFYQVRGVVEHGRKRGGDLLGFPTANIRLADELCPATGVYAVTVEGPMGFHLGVANIGYSPTFDDKVFTVEVYLLDFKGELYGQKIRVNFVKRLRSEKKFSGVDALSAQIKQDVEETRRVLAEKGIRKSP